MTLEQFAEQVAPMMEAYANERVAKLMAPQWYETPEWLAQREAERQAEYWAYLESGLA